MSNKEENGTKDILDSLFNYIYFLNNNYICFLKKRNYNNEFLEN